MTIIIVIIIAEIIIKMTFQVTIILQLYFGTTIFVMVDNIITVNTKHFSLSRRSTP